METITSNQFCTSCQNVRINPVPSHHHQYREELLHIHYGGRRNTFKRSQENRTSLYESVASFPTDVSMNRDHWRDRDDDDDDEAGVLMLRGIFTSGDEAATDG